MQKLCLDKRGKGGNSFQIFISILAIVVVVAIVIGVVRMSVGGGIAGSDGDCEVEPYVDAVTSNVYALSSNISPAYSYQIDDEPARTMTSGSSGTTFEVGDSFDIFTSLSAYEDTKESFEITKCGSNKFSNTMYATDGGTIDILSQNLVEVSDDATATSAVNLTNGGSTNAVNFIIRIDGVVKETTGQLYVTVEVNDSDVDLVTISGKSGDANVVDDDAEILKLFSAEGTTPSLKTAFIVDSVINGAQVDYNVRLTPESGVTMGLGNSGFIFVNAYEGQWFIDSDGSLQYGWEDALGTAKHEGAFSDHDALIS